MSVSRGRLFEIVVAAPLCVCVCDMCMFVYVCDMCMFMYVCVKCM